MTRQRFYHRSTCHIVNIYLVVLRCLNDLFVVDAKFDSRMVFRALMSRKLSNKSSICQINYFWSRVHAGNNTEWTFLCQIKAVDRLPNINLKQFALSKIIDSHFTIHRTRYYTIICHQNFSSTVFKVTKSLYRSLVSTHQVPETHSTVHAGTCTNRCILVYAYRVYLLSMTFKFSYVGAF